MQFIIHSKTERKGDENVHGQILLNKNYGNSNNNNLFYYAPGILTSKSSLLNTH